MKKIMQKHLPACDIKLCCVNKAAKQLFMARARVFLSYHSIFMVYKIY